MTATLDAAAIDIAYIHTNLTHIGTVTTRDQRGMISYTPDATGQLWKRIGRITVSCYTAMIDVWPCAGVHFNDSDQAALDGVAVATWMDSPLMRKNRNSQWTLRHDGEYGPYWELIVSIPVSGVLSLPVKFATSPN